MRRGMFLKLALTNIKKNRETYIPYIFSCVGCITVLYIMMFIVTSPDIVNMRGGRDVSFIVSMGVFVLGVFSVIFLLFCNSFLMKRRQKEFGLYNVLGMEKRHISHLMFVETVITGFISLTGGLAAGILGSKLALLLLLKILHIPAKFGFYISREGIKVCSVSYGVILVLTLFNNLKRVHFSRPVELLSGGNAGEREPKSKLLMAVLGFICLGIGYYLAVTTESVMDAFGVFFIAVLLVMAGTYLVFTAGSIVILKLLRRRKKFYYKIQNFTSISGMLYRMKQNAVGLASICILSTGVLLMISTTVCLNMGIEDMARFQFPYDVNIDFYVHSLEEAYTAQEFIRTELEKKDMPVESVESQIYLSLVGFLDGNRLSLNTGAGEIRQQTVVELVVIPVDFYEKTTGEKLEPGEMFAYGIQDDRIIIEGKEFCISKTLKKCPRISGLFGVDYVKSIYLVADEKNFEKINQLQNEVQDSGYSISSKIGVQLQGDDATAIACRQEIDDSIQEFVKQGHFSQKENLVTIHSYAEEKENFYGLNGGLLFVGILLGGVFLMGTAMIIYYKQISEGYEDKARFEIMRKVGMSRREVKSSIHRQILMVFFLPLITACVHIGMAFPLMKRLLLLLSMQNTRLFLICTAATVLVFAAVYAVIYAVTARAYYRILEKAE